MPREESFPIPRRYIDVTRATSTTLDVMFERRIDDYWNIEGDRDLSVSWTGFTRFAILDEKPPDGFSSSGERLTKKQSTSRLDYLWQRHGKSGLSNNRSLTMLVGCEVFTSLIQRMRSSKKLFQKCAEKVGSSDASNCALQDQEKKVQGHLSHS